MAKRAPNTFAKISVTSALLEVVKQPCMNSISNPNKKESKKDTYTTFEKLLNLPFLTKVIPQKKVKNRCKRMCTILSIPTMLMERTSDDFIRQT